MYIRVENFFVILLCLRVFNFCGGVYYGKSRDPGDSE